MSYWEILNNVDINNNVNSPFVIEKKTSSQNVWDTSKYVVGFKDHTDKKGNYEYNKIYQQYIYAKPMKAHTLRLVYYTKN